VHGVLKTFREYPWEELTATSNKLETDFLKTDILEWITLFHLPTTMDFSYTDLMVITSNGFTNIPKEPIYIASDELGLCDIAPICNHDSYLCLSDEEYYLPYDGYLANLTACQTDCGEGEYDCMLCQ
jgi:hypothetical protein